MILAAIALSSALTIEEPKRAAFCDNSRLGLTDNAPLDNKRETSVVNIWAFVKLTDPSAPAAGWVYKNMIGQYTFQGSQFNKDLPSALKDAGYGTRMWTPKFAGSNLEPITFTDSEQLVRLENVLSEHGYVRAACFRHDLLIQF